MIKVYLAGPWFYGDQPARLSKVEACLDSYTDLEVFSPRRETLITPNAGADARRMSFEMNVKHVFDSDIIVALVDDSDKGTLFECGLAYAHDVPILYYCESANVKPFNLMLAESCTQLGYVTNVDELRDRMDKILSIGAENMTAKKFEGEIE